MARVVWNHPENARYEVGVDRGVLYPKDSTGVAWNGLISVSEDSSGGEISPNYYEGLRVSHSVATTTYQATIKAFTCPSEFRECLGELELVSGFYLTGQRKRRFDLSYRTNVGDSHYKIHLVYNATATPASKATSTLGGPQDKPSDLSWKLEAVPVEAGNYMPTAHFVVDSMDADPVNLALLELFLYGNDANDPFMPPISDIKSLFQS